MKLDKKLLALVLATAVVIAGMIFEPSGGAPSVLRYVISNAGQFLIIILAALIGYERFRLFTFKSSIGKALVLISLGLLSWGVASIGWLYYNVVLRVDVPYPSFSDIFFLLLIPFAAYGLFLLLKGIKFESGKRTMLKLSVLPIIVFVLTYMTFIGSKLADDVSMLEKILNVAYPLGDAVLLSLAIVVLSLVRGAKMFKAMSIMCAGFIILAVSDFSFSWTTQNGTYYVGSWVDILFSLAFLTIGLGMYHVKIE